LTCCVFVFSFNANAGFFQKKNPETPPVVINSVEPSALVGPALLVDEKKQKNESHIYGYDYWFPKYVNDYLKLVDQSPVAIATPVGGDVQCQNLYKNSLAKGSMDIRYALGYFDDSQGIDVVYDGTNYGLSPSLDIEIFHVVRNALKAKCEDNRLLCGFNESGDPEQGQVELTKTIQLFGKDVLVKMTLTHASASDNFEANKSTLKDRQDFLTKQSEQNYFGGIGVADVVFYNGHSRNGGGPDFNPPLLNSELHVNYDGYYRVKQPGIRRVLSQLKTNPNKDSIMGFFSCFSQSHFYDMLIKANPKQRLVLSADKINYLNSLEASVGYLEGFMHGQCGQNLADMAKQGDVVKVGFKGFQLK
jgi:hypothetical protein